MLTFKSDEKTIKFVKLITVRNSISALHMKSPIYTTAGLRPPAFFIDMLACIHSLCTACAGCGQYTNLLVFHLDGLRPNLRHV